MANAMYSNGMPIYVDPDTGVWRACTDPERALGFTVDGDLAAISTPALQEVLMTNKKTNKKKASRKIDLEQNITAIVRKYIVVREGPLGVIQYIPFGKVPELIKDIQQLVLDYIASMPKRKPKTDKNPTEDLDVWDEVSKKIWKKIKKDIDKETRKNDNGWTQADPFDPFHVPAAQPITPRPGTWRVGTFEMRDNIPPETRA